MGALGSGILEGIKSVNENRLHRAQIEHLTAQAEHMKQQTAQIKAINAMREAAMQPTPPQPILQEGPRPTGPAQEVAGPGAPIPTGLQPGEGFTQEELAQPLAGYGTRQESLNALQAQGGSPFVQEGPRPMGQAPELEGPGAPIQTGMTPPGPSQFDQLMAGLSPEYQSMARYVAMASPEHLPALLQHAITKEKPYLHGGPGTEFLNPQTLEVVHTVPSEPRQLTNPVDQRVAVLSGGKYKTLTQALDAGEAKMATQAEEDVRETRPEKISGAQGVQAEQRRQAFRPGEIKQETAAHVEGAQQGQLKTFLGEKHDNWIDPTTLKPAKANQTFGEVYQKYTHLDDQQKPAMAQVRTLSNGLVRIEELGDKILRARKGVTWKDAPAGIAQALNLSAKELAGDPDVEELQAIITQLTVPMAKLQGDTANVAVAERQMIGGSIFKKTDTIESLRRKTSNMLNVIENTLNGLGLNGTAYVQDTLAKQSMAKSQRGVASQRPVPSAQNKDVDEEAQYLEQQKQKLREKVQPSGALR